MKIAADTNVLARYLVWDDQTQSAEAAAAVESADAVFISPIVLCELAWVLKRAYRYPAPEISDAIGRLVRSRQVEVDLPAALAGLRMLGHNGDFADGVIQFEADRAKCGKLVTFDRGFARRADGTKIALLGASPKR